MNMKLEKWLDANLGVLEDEAEFSPAARERIFSEPQGVTAVPAGGITPFIARPGDEEYVYYVQVAVRTGHMTEEEVDSSCQLIDMRLLNDKHPKYDNVFAEVRTRAAQTRHKRVCVLAQNMRELDLVSYEVLEAAQLPAEEIRQA